MGKDATIRELFRQRNELLAGLQLAVERCGCSVAERESGHLIDCYAPQLLEIIAKTTQHRIEPPRVDNG